MVSCSSLNQNYFTLTPNKAGLFEGIFSCDEGGGGGGQFDPSPTPPFMFQEELIQFQKNFIQLLNSLFKVC